VLRRQRRQSAAFVVLTFTALSGVALVASPPAAYAEVGDGTLTVLVNRDEDGDSTYDNEIDPPQPGIEVAVTDAAGASVRGITNDDGQFVLTGTDRLAGGQYLVSAAIPPNLSELAPVTTSETFAPFSTTVDLRGGNQTIRLGVASMAVAGVASPAAPHPSGAAPTTDGRPPGFAVGDKVWRDLDRSGRQDEGEPPAAGISVQLLTVDGDVVESTVSSAAGRFSFDDLPGGTYAVRFAGVPSGWRLAPAGSGEDPSLDSDPDYTGATPPFTLGVGEPHVRQATAADGVSAAYVHSGIDAGIIPLRYAIGDRVWLDANADGAQQPDEPPAAATVSLLWKDRVVASTTTDAEGFYRFTGLEAGDYWVRFEPGEHRRFTARNATSDPTQDSDADPRTGVTAVVTVGPDAPELVPAVDLGVTEADLVNATVSAGLVGAYAIGDTVWRDDNGNGVLDAGEGGFPGIKVQLLDEGQQVLHQAVTTGDGRFAFGDLTAGTYRLRFLPPGGALVFTGARTGSNPAVDSDASSDGLTSPVVLGETNPDDTTVDAGLTSPANLSMPPIPTDATPVPADTRLSTTGGVAVSIPIAGLALVASGLSCLFVARRPPLP
jgi:hypothetical protein